ncbi:MAG: hypothetical protein U0517_00815 [Candidatus Andersenbacteria bacterium]
MTKKDFITKQQKLGSRSISFEENLRLLSGKKGSRSLKALRGLWEVVEFSRSSHSGNCQLCHQAIKMHAVIIRKDDPELRAIIGHDCAEKLIIFNCTGQIRAVRREIAGYKRGLLWYLNRALGPQGEPRKTIASIKAWLEAQTELPISLQTTRRHVLALGYPPSQEHAEALVTYYKHHCVFAASDILTKAELELFDQYKGYLGLKSEITLNELEEVRTQLASAQKDCELAWAKVAKQLLKGVPTERFDQIEVQYAQIVLTYKGFTVHAVNWFSFDGKFVLQAVPAMLRLKRIDRFLPQKQWADVQFDQVTWDAWTAQATQLWKEEVAQREAQKAAQEAKEEEERRAALAQRIRQPIKMDSVGVINIVPEGNTLSRLYFFAATAQFNLLFDAEGLDHKLLKATLPSELRIESCTLSEHHRSVTISLNPAVLDEWRERARLLLESRRVANRKRLAEMLERDRHNGLVRDLDFVEELLPRSRLLRSKSDYPFRSVHHANGTTYVLSPDDSYQASEGKVMVWVEQPTYTPTERTVRRLQLVEHPDGAVTWSYLFRPHGPLSPGVLRDALTAKD